MCGARPRASGHTRNHCTTRRVLTTCGFVYDANPSPELRPLSLGRDPPGLRLLSLGRDPPGLSLRTQKVLFPLTWIKTGSVQLLLYEQNGYAADGEKRGSQWTNSPCSQGKLRTKCQCGDGPGCPAGLRQTQRGPSPPRLQVSVQLQPDPARGSEGGDLPHPPAVSAPMSPPPKRSPGLCCIPRGSLNASTRKTQAKPCT